MEPQETMIKGRLATIPISQIRESKAAVREVDQSTEKWAEFLSNIRAIGVIKPILVTEYADPDKPGETVYMLSDGLHRLTAAKAAGFTEIDAKIADLTEAKLLQTQMMLNLHVVTTKPVEFAKGVIRLLGLYPTWTMKDACNALNANVGWMNQRLSLLKLTEAYQKLVEEDKLPLVNAYALAKLPPEEQANFVDRAQTMPPDVFVQLANERAKQLKDDANKGKQASTETFIATPHGKKVAELKAEAESGLVAAALKTKGVISDEESFKTGVAWAIHMDPISVETARLAWEVKMKDKNDKARAKLLSNAEEQKKKAEEILANLAATHTGEVKA